MRYTTAQLCAAALLPAAIASPALGQSSWNTAADGLWSNAANWSAGVPNGAADDAVIDATGAPYTVTGDLNVDLNTLTLNSADALLFLDDRTFTLTDKIQIDAGQIESRGITNLNGMVVNNSTITSLGSSSGGHGTLNITDLENAGQFTRWNQIRSATPGKALRTSSGVR